MDREFGARDIQPPRVSSVPFVVLCQRKKEYSVSCVLIPFGPIPSVKAYHIWKHDETHGNLHDGPLATQKAQAQAPVKLRSSFHSIHPLLPAGGRSHRLASLSGRSHSAMDSRGRCWETNCSQLPRLVPVGQYIIWCPWHLFCLDVGAVLSSACSSELYGL